MKRLFIVACMLLLMVATARAQSSCGGGTLTGLTPGNGISILPGGNSPISGNAIISLQQPITLTAAMNAGGHQINNLADGTAPGDAVNLFQLKNEPGAGVGSVTASPPLTSSGGSNPNIALDVTPTANGGTDTSYGEPKITQETINCPSGTTINSLATYDMFNGAVCLRTSTISDTTNIAGIVIGYDAINPNYPKLVLYGPAPCTFDGVGAPIPPLHYVINSGTVNGDCTDGGTSLPTSSQPLGITGGTVAGAGVYTINLWVPAHNVKQGLVDGNNNIVNGVNFAGTNPNKQVQIITDAPGQAVPDWGIQSSTGISEAWFNPLTLSFDAGNGNLLINEKPIPIPGININGPVPDGSGNITAIITSATYPSIDVQSVLLTQNLNGVILPPAPVGEEVRFNFYQGTLATFALPATGPLTTTAGLFVRPANNACCPTIGTAHGAAAVRSELHINAINNGLEWVMTACYGVN